MDHTVIKLQIVGLPADMFTYNDQFETSFFDENSPHAGTAAAAIVELVAELSEEIDVVAASGGGLSVVTFTIYETEGLAAMPEPVADLMNWAAANNMGYRAVSFECDEIPGQGITNHPAYGTLWHFAVDRLGRVTLPEDLFHEMGRRNRNSVLAQIDEYFSRARLPHTSG